MKLYVGFKLWSCSTAAVAWSLHRNLGFPLDLIDLMLEERNMAVDKRGVEQLAAQQEQVPNFSTSVIKTGAASLTEGAVIRSGCVMKSCHAVVAESV